ncbi:MAG: cob(I)yrinic acid a,c-diamide adenosyltransferase [Planctomycetota bacterium]
MKLYTRSGDDGTTGLFGGDRVAKDHPRVEAYGTVDELNAAVGLARAACDPDQTFGQRLIAIFESIQSRLFDIGADLATPAGSPHEDKVLRISDAQVKEAEQWIDEIDGGNEPMKSFILPGGTELAARLHVARTICRRAERMMLRVHHQEPITEGAIVYINRLSDLLFAMARRANREAGTTDIPWTGPEKG